MIPHIRYARIDSTNACLKALARQGGAEAPFYVTADLQTAGRGRLGRSFLSPKGGLYMSVLVRPVLPLMLTTPLAAVAVCETVEEMCGLRLGIKWVNDLFLRGKKVCGILAEAVGDCAVIGIGLNLVTPEGGFPGVPVAGALDTDADGEALAARIAEKIAEGCARADGRDMLEGYRARMLLTGKTVNYIRNGQTFSGTVQGVDDMGGLIVTHGGATETLRTGEVTIGSGSLFGL